MALWLLRPSVASVPCMAVVFHDVLTLLTCLDISSERHCGRLAIDVVIRYVFFSSQNSIDCYCHEYRFASGFVFSCQI